jgi:hypothetical protein
MSESLDILEVIRISRPLQRPVKALALSTELRGHARVGEQP